MTLPCRPSAVVFDMDGLLFDTEALYQKAIMAAAVQGGHDTSSGIFEHAIGRTWDQTRAMLREHFGAAFPVEEFIAAMARNFDEMALTRLVMKPGVVELLDTPASGHRYIYRASSGAAPSGRTQSGRAFPCDCRTWRLRGQQARTRSLSESR